MYESLRPPFILIRLRTIHESWIDELKQILNFMKILQLQKLNEKGSDQSLFFMFTFC